MTFKEQRNLKTFLGRVIISFSENLRKNYCRISLAVLRALVSKHLTKFCESTPIVCTINHYGLAMYCKMNILDSKLVSLLLLVTFSGLYKHTIILHNLPIFRISLNCNVLKYRCTWSTMVLHVFHEFIGQ